MAITTVLFDLDGTLLPMDQEVFLRDYLGRLAAALAPHGYDPKQLLAMIWKGTEAMLRNNGEKTNEEVFWDVAASVFGERIRADEPLFAHFYATEFDQVRTVCGFAPQAAPLVKELKARGFGVALATNPLFPAAATERRIRWAGLEPDDFALYTTYENSRHTKPNPRYYEDVAAALGVDPACCLMVGNDVDDDLPAAQVGMQVFLLTDCLINKRETNLDSVPHGDFSALRAYLDALRTEKSL